MDCSVPMLGANALFDSDADEFCLCILEHAAQESCHCCEMDLLYLQVLVTVRSAILVWIGVMLLHEPLATLQVITLSEDRQHCH